MLRLNGTLAFPFQSLLFKSLLFTFIRAHQKLWGLVIPRAQTGKHVLLTDL